MAFAFSSTIEYNLDNMECFLYNIFAESLSNNAFFNILDVCDVEIITTLGGSRIQSNVLQDVCEYLPCFIESSSSSLRRLLQNKDASITMIIIAADSSTYNVITKIDLVSLEQDFQDEFEAEFALNVLLDISGLLYFIHSTQCVVLK